MNKNDTFCSLARQIASAGTIYSIAYLIINTEGSTLRAFPLTLIAYAPAVYLLNRLFLFREHSIRALIIFNSILGAAYFASVFIADGLIPFIGMVMVFFICAFVTIRGCTAAIKAPELREMVQSLDVSAIITAAFTLYITFMEKPVSLLIPVIAGFAFAAAGTAARRMGSSIRAGNIITMLAFFAAVCAAAALAAEGAAEPLRDALTEIWKGICSVGRFIGGILHKLFLLLASLIKDPGPIELEAEPPASLGAVQMEEYVEENGLLAVAVICVILFFLLLFFLIRVFGRNKAGGKRIAAHGKLLERTHVPFLPALKRWLGKLRALLKTELFLKKNRDTPLGIYYSAERLCRRTPLRRKTGETPREFMCRLAEALPESAAMDELLPKIDEALFGCRVSSEKVGEAAQIRKMIRQLRYKFSVPRKKRISDY